MSLRTMREARERQTILAVDDKLVNLKVLIRYLEQCGFELMVARSGGEALSRMDSILPDIILLDVLMPGMDGFETCRRLKEDERTQDIPVIFMTALANTADKVKGFEAGAVDYLCKPLQQEEVLARVNTHLTIRHLQQELEARNRELARLVNVDGLTQIANRRYFDDCLRREWLQMARERGQLSLIFIDIDYFKKYNDRYGHQAGDDCLKKVAGILADVSRRPADLVARYGGEEFVVLLPNTDLDGAEQVARNIRQSLRAERIPHEESSTSPYVTLSMGVACRIPDRTEPVETLVTMADEATYRAKGGGRDRYVSVTERT